jgi:hypothetical protein
MYDSTLCQPVDGISQVQDIQEGNQGPNLGESEKITD